MIKKVAQPTASVAEETKALIPDPTLRIVLGDFVSSQVKTAVEALSLQNFPSSVPFAAEAFVGRIRQYEQIISDIRTISMLMSYWGEPRHQFAMERIVTRISEVEKGNAGTVVWLRLGWYPVLQVQYAAGIAAVAAENWGALKTILTARVEGDEGGLMTERAAIVRVSRAMGEIVDAFKQVSGNPQHFVPLSEYLFQIMKKPLEDTVDIDRRYETLFDRFEVLAALACADELKAAGSGPWCLLGRFAWKRQRGNDPFGLVIAEAEKQGEAWGPLKAGLFGGSPARFKEVASDVAERIRHISWF